MGNLCARKSQEELNNSDETDSEVLLGKKLISAAKNENDDIIKGLLDEFFNTSYFVEKSWSLDSQPKKQNNELESKKKQIYKYKIWRDAMYIAMEKETKHSEEIMKLFLDCDIIWSLETKICKPLLCQLFFETEGSDDKKQRLIEMILKSGKINVNTQSKYLSTAMHFADEEKLISLLIHYGADVNKKNYRGNTPLNPSWDSPSSGWLTILKDARSLMDLDAIDCKGRTALMKAAIRGRPDVVELLLNAGASVNLSDHLGFTALHHALYALYDFRFFLNNYDYLPRNYEGLKQRKKIFSILFHEKDAKVHRKRRYKRYKETQEKNIESVKILLQRPEIDVNALSFEKISPLDIAEVWIPEISISIKDALKEKGAVLNVFRQTEIHSTSNFQLDGRCRLVLQDLLSNLYRHFKHWNILPGYLFKKRLLTIIETFKGQIVSGKDQKGRTALHLVAIYFSNILVEDKYSGDKHYLRDLSNKIVEKMIKIGCSVNETDIYGRTPLHYADEILMDSFISHGADTSIKDKDGNIAIEESPEQSSDGSYFFVNTIINRNKQTYIIQRINNKQMEIKVKCADSQDRTSDDRVFSLETAKRLLWELGEYALRHPLVKQITKEMIYLMNAIAEEIERLDPRFASKPDFVGSSNEGTKRNKPDEFDFCFVLTKISELCEVSQSPELPTGFVRLKRKSTKKDEENDFANFFGKDEILNTEKLKWQFTTILRNALVNIESQQSLDCILEMPMREYFEEIDKASNIKVIRPLNLSSVDYISIDIVPCIHIDGWWPDESISNVSDDIKTCGCNLILDRPHKLYPWVPYSDSCARISFAKAECEMIKQSCDNAKEAYMIGKTMIDNSALYYKLYEETSKYALKNCLLYCIEALAPTSEKASHLGLSLEELETKFHQMDRYLWLKCLLKCHLEFVSQDFCPCYFLPNYYSPIGKKHLKESSLNWMTRDLDTFPIACRMAYALYRCTSNDISGSSCCQLPAPDPLWEHFDRNQLIANLCEMAYSNLKHQ